MLPFVTTGTDPEGVMLSDTSPMRKDKQHVISLIMAHETNKKRSETKRTQIQTADRWAPEERGLGEGKMGEGSNARWQAGTGWLVVGTPQRADAEL